MNISSTKKTWTLRVSLTFLFTYTIQQTYIRPQTFATLRRCNNKSKMRMVDPYEEKTKYYILKLLHALKSTVITSDIDFDALFESYGTTHHQRDTFDIALMCSLESIRGHKQFC